MCAQHYGLCVCRAVLFEFARSERDLFMQTELRSLTYGVLRHKEWCFEVILGATLFQR